ncbi:MAG: dTMP kinase [Kaiparowitsia implicata GSE-PSE-MK54-09C]|jgi:dTMP kinase|nr:dTMP kinase [Kaiparowitsia implicata GSE-PSE-MK54-09C]
MTVVSDGDRPRSEAVCGKLIVFEGVEGSGKTTQMTRLCQWLDVALQTQPELHRLKTVIATREPGGTPLGTEMRQVLLYPTAQEPMAARAELLLYAADRAQHVETLLKPQLAQGHLIVCDRFTDSTVAYQGYGRGLDLDLINQLNAIATSGLDSDLTLWLDLEAEVGLARAQRRSHADRMEQNILAFHQRVQQGFAALAAAHPHRIVRIDARQAEERVAASIQQVVQQHLTRWYAPSGAIAPNL